MIVKNAGKRGDAMLIKPASARLSAVQYEPGVQANNLKQGRCERFEGFPHNEKGRDEPFDLSLISHTLEEVYPQPRASPQN
ncbi:hypothetical protein VTL71DRAFT_11183, partial [Oculimacula yallundae]